MTHGRTITFLLVVLVSIASLAGAQVCEPDEILATSVADTIFVEHRSAERNCCTELTIRVEIEGFTVDFFEGDAGDWCLCLCCFDLEYSAYGFAAGHYTVRVWNEDGSELYGETEVDVEESGGTPSVASIDRGDCMAPGGIEEVLEIPVTWGTVRAVYR